MALKNVPESDRRVRSPKISKLVADDLRKRIRDGEWKPGEMLPPENHLATDYEISRGTIRTALQYLSNIGLVVTKHGAGTYVTRMGDALSSNIAELISTTKMIETAGMEAHMYYTSSIERPATEIDARLLPVRIGESVFEIRRHVEADGMIASVAFDIIPKRVFPADFKASDFEGSLLSQLDEHGTHIKYANSDIHAVTGKDFGLDQECKYECFIALHQVHYDTAHNPIYFSRTYFRDSLFQFSIFRTRAD